MCMRTNIEIDEKLIATAQKLGNIKTKKSVVEKALQLFIQIENQKKILDLRGEVSFFENIESE